MARTSFSKSPSPIAIIGIPGIGLAELEQAKIELIRNYDCIFLAATNYQIAKGYWPKDRLRTFPKPLFPELVNQLDRAWQSRQKIAILASGDPLWYGIAASIRRKRPLIPMRVIPAVSSFQLAAAQLLWPLADCKLVSLHGRPLAEILRHLFAKQKILCLSDGSQTPKLLADLLLQFDPDGAKASAFWLLSQLTTRPAGFAAAPKSLTVTQLLQLPAATIGPRHVLGIDWQGHGASLTAGLADDLFITDGNITKRAIRASSLAWLAPEPQALLWDIGCGSGSISIEWCRLGGVALAVDCNKKRIDLTTANLEKFGLRHRCQTLLTKAPARLEDVASNNLPQAIFLGGGLSEYSQQQLALFVRLLAKSGRLVANTISIAGEQLLLAAWQKYGGQLQRIGIEQALPITGNANIATWQGRRTVTQWLWQKP